ncbi:RecX family transcriptional regulator [bacterium]|nr:RecX family transcriptional regulator [bacterium]
MDNIKKPDSDILSQTLKIIARRDMSKNELIAKLTAKKFNARKIDDVIDYLTNKNFYNEQRAAYEIAQSKLRRSLVGIFFIKRMLLSKKFPPDIIEYTLAILFDKEFSEKELALKCAEKKLFSLDRKYSAHPQRHLKTKSSLSDFLYQK